MSDYYKFYSMSRSLGNFNCYNRTKRKTKEKYMSYMIVFSNGDKPVLVTDSRVIIGDGYTDNNKKIFVNSDKTVAYGFVGPKSFIYNGVEFDIFKFIFEKLSAGINFMDVLNSKIGNITLKEVLKESFTDRILTIFIITKDKLPIEINYYIEEDMITILMEKHLLCRGDFPSNIVLKMIDDKTNLKSFSIKELENKAIRTMENIIRLSEEFAGYEGKSSTIGGEIQSIIL